MKDAIAAGELDPNDLESIKKLRASVPVATVPAPLYRYQRLRAFWALLNLDEVHELERERTVYQKKRLMSIEKARACRGVGETSHDIADHSPEHSSSNRL